MNTIDVQQIGTNRYAPAGADAVRLYSTNGSEGLTLAQLVAAVCIRRSAHLEARGRALKVAGHMRGAAPRYSCTGEDSRLWTCER